MSTVDLWAMADLATPMAIRVAATLHLADHLANGATDPAELASRTDTDPRALTRLLDHLADAGVVSPTSRGRYRLTDLGAQLIDAHPAGIRSWLDLDGAIGHADLAFFGLLDSVRTGAAAYPKIFGTGFWDDLDANPALSASFDALMGEHPAVADVLDGYDWSPVEQVADVGGGDGTLLAALLAAQPHLRGTLVERPGPAQAAAQTFRAAGVADRVTVVSGSFFDPIPAGAQVYVLSRVLGDWDDEHVVAILRRCAAAAGERGRVLVLEEGFASQDSNASTEMDLRMLVYCAGRDRSLAELTALAGTAGLRVCARHPAGSSTLVELAPTGKPARQSTRARPARPARPAKKSTTRPEKRPERRKA